MGNTLIESKAADVLDRLFIDAEKEMTQHTNTPQNAVPPKPTPPAEITPLERFSVHKEAYLAIDRPFGNLLYSLIRANGAKTVVEFGTSFGISTIFLAAALRDNGAGKVITTEFIPEKAETARKNIADAGLGELVEFRVGDAVETLKEPLPGPVDFLFLDGEKTMYIDVLKRLEPQMSAGCLIASDNTDLEGTHSCIEYMRAAGSGYISTPVLIPGGPKHDSGHELSVRL